MIIDPKKEKSSSLEPNRGLIMLYMAVFSVSMAIIIGLGHVSSGSISMNPQWHKSPPMAGWYHMAKSIEDWDISECVGVTTHTYMDGSVDIFARYRNAETDIDSLCFKENIWWGPLPNRVKPTEEDIARLSEPSDTGKS